MQIHLISEMISNASSSTKPLLIKIVQQIRYCKKPPSVFSHIKEHLKSHMAHLTRKVRKPAGYQQNYQQDVETLSSSRARSFRWRPSANEIKYAKLRANEVECRPGLSANLVKTPVKRGVKNKGPSIAPQSNFISARPRLSTILSTICE